MVECGLIAISLTPTLVQDENEETDSSMPDLCSSSDDEGENFVRRRGPHSFQSKSTGGRLSKEIQRRTSTILKVKADCLIASAGGDSGRKVRFPNAVHKRARYRDKNPSLGVIQSGPNIQDPNPFGLDCIGSNITPFNENLARQRAWKLNKQVFKRHSTYRNE